MDAMKHPELPFSTLQHVLMCMSYFCGQERFATVLEDIKMIDKVEEFKEHYAQLNPTGNLFFIISINKNRG